MGFLSDKWNKNKFSIYDSEEKTVLKLFENMKNFLGNDVIKEVDKKTDNLGNHLGAWQGLNKPTLSEEGMRSTVEQHIVKMADLDNKYASVKRREKQYINVKEFKCDDGQYVQGDNVHDDTTGIQRAIDYATNNVGVLFFPNGSYLTTNTLYVTTALEIEGEGRKGIITYTPQKIFGAEIVNDFDGVTMEVKRESVIYGFKIRNLRIRNKKQNYKGVGLRLVGHSEYIIDNVNINGFFENGLELTSCFIALHSNCDIANNKNGVVFNTIQSVYGINSMLIFDNINCWDNTFSHFNITNTLNYLNVKNSWFEYSQNAIYFNNEVYACVCDNMTFTNLVISNGGSKYTNSNSINCVSKSNMNITLTNLKFISCDFFNSGSEHNIIFEINNNTNVMTTLNNIFFNNTVLRGATTSGIKFDKAYTSISFNNLKTITGFSGTEIPNFSTNVVGKIKGVNMDFEKTNIYGPINFENMTSAPLSAFKKGDMSYVASSGMLRLHDGTNWRIIPFQGETVPNTQASDVATLQADFNRLLNVLRASGIIKS